MEWYVLSCVYKALNLRHLNVTHLKCEASAPLGRVCYSWCLSWSKGSIYSSFFVGRVFVDHFKVARILKHFFPKESQECNRRENCCYDVDKQIKYLFSVDLTTDATTSNIAVNGTAPEQQEDDSSFSLLTWNIDGLDLGNQQDRARGVCSYLALYSPDVVFLQEVIPPYLCYLQKRAGNYTIIPGNIDGYFTAVMLKNSRVKLVKQEIVPFPTTSMMRNLLVVHVNVAGNELCLMTSHLESTKDHSKERIKQLQTVFKNMQKESESTTVIFGGDTNLRDSEVNKLGGLPESIVDIWEFLGKPKHCRYTWDTSCNSNLAAAYTCKLRFDRVYLRPAPRGAQLLPRSMDLIGLEKLDCGRFPSDHWGVLCHFDVIL
uniref:Tyrosyl-DNA phosphodiesterase 2 n=1 Tax=Nothoprocta perdicaria TaxID=30464 RepID=A0A8C6YSR3_NOTPE